MGGGGGGQRPPTIIKFLGGWRFHSPDQVTVTLPDGKALDFKPRRDGREIAAAIGPGLAKAALILEVDGKQWDLFRPIEQDAKIRIITKKDPEALELIRHDAAHVLAMAVQELYPGTQVTIGPAIDDGFYYDFARAEPFTPEDLPKIEAKMHEIIKARPADPPRSVAARQGRRAFQGHRRELQGRADREHPGGRGRLDLLSRRLARPVPRPAFSRPPARSATPSS